ncbi:hypothetical protein LOD99_2068 [Oopsacas minuta]|uniref:Uncharacterized protein n=1 Tax=Oopsacas minuta TaxID=111878 RepID=A0AAV7K4E4_9METZ|nr:hypothetical protein LOD99_2068 [Oopsacas minuta]
MSSRETGSGFNWKQILIVTAPIALSLAAVVTIYIYYSRKKRKEGNQDIHTSEDLKKDKKTTSVRPLTPEQSQANEEPFEILKSLPSKGSLHLSKLPVVAGSQVWAIRGMREAFES